MKLSLGSISLLIAACSSYPISETTQLGRDLLELEGVEEGAFAVCVDFTDQPHGTIVVKNVSNEALSVAFATTGFLSTTTTGSVMDPGTRITLRADLLGPLPPDRIRSDPVQAGMI